MRAAYRCMMIDKYGLRDFKILTMCLILTRRFWRVKYLTTGLNI